MSKDKQEEYSRNNMASPDKTTRVSAYMHSSGMVQSLTYQNNEGGFEVMGSKPNNRGYVPPETLKKDQWKPKTTLKWHEPYRTPLTLQ
jgi:hypothetical protein